MKNTKTINVTFDNEDMIQMYELKITQRWTWEEMIRETIKFWNENHE